MTERTPHPEGDAHNRKAQPAARASTRGTILPGSQGTDSVHRTWCSEGNAGRHHRPTAERTGTPSPPLVKPRLDRIAEQAQQYPDMAFTTLAHHLDVAMLERAFWGLNPAFQAGVIERTGDFEWIITGTKAGLRKDGDVFAVAEWRNRSIDASPGTRGMAGIRPV